jgi:hypothetical protein
MDLIHIPVWQGKFVQKFCNIYKRWNINLMVESMGDYNKDSRKIKKIIVQMKSDLCNK